MGILSRIFKKKQPKQYTQEELQYHYDTLWITSTINPEIRGSIYPSAKKLFLSKARYELVADIVKCPWWLVAVIHNMECSGDFNLGLHCGQRWDMVTTLAPKGCGPFKSWEDAAVDALMMKSGTMPRGKPDMWMWLYFLEKYNGLGYLQWHSEVNSPYLWSGTCAYSKGKYGSDSKWNPDLVSKQIGCVPLIRMFIELDRLNTAPV